MGITDQFLIELSKLLFIEARRFFSSAIVPEDDLYNRLDRHLSRVSNWARSYNFLGLGIPKDSDTETISLRFTTIPRRLAAKKVKRAICSETDMLKSNNNLIVLGAPGSGKTTTLRRLALFLLMSESSDIRDTYQYPLLIILREIPENIFLCEVIADILGIKFNKTLRQSPESRTQNSTVAERKYYSIKVGDYEIEDVLAKMLNESNALLIIDGLDELHYQHKKVIEQDIESLGSRLTSSKIIVSCRSGDYTSNLNNFEVLEVLPLNKEEIEEIAKIWIPNYVQFLSEMSKLPYKDIVDRPLLLSFLLYLFATEGELPDQPSLIYRKVVYRLLKEWDEERRITRKSKYSHFDPDRKIDFLSELAYQLTCEIKGKIFTEEIFRTVYLDIHKSFNLPKNEVREVATELETHTGIIFSSGLNQFEFSHLSIQEYLCANYICRSPFQDLLAHYLISYPAPIAVACALSSNPSLFFSELVIRQIVDKFKDLNDPLSYGTDARQLKLFSFSEDSFRSFLSRILIENPYFKINLQFGNSIFCVFAFYFRRYSREMDELLLNFLKLPAVFDSLRLSVAQMGKIMPYTLSTETVVFEMDEWFKKIYEYKIGSVEILNDILKKRPLPLVLFPNRIFKKIYRKKYQEFGHSSTIYHRVKNIVMRSPFKSLEENSKLKITFDFPRSKFLRTWIKARR